VKSFAGSSGHSRRPSGLWVFTSLQTVAFALAFASWAGCGPRHVRHGVAPEIEDAGADAALPGTGGAGGAPGTGGEGGSAPAADAALTSGAGGTGGSGGTSPPDAATPDAAPRDAPRRPDATAPPPRDVAVPDLASDPMPPPDLAAPDVAPPDAAPGPDLTRGLVGYWKFDEGTGTTAADSSPGNNPGTLTNGVQWVPGAPFPTSNNAISLDGMDDFVAVQKNLAPVLGGTATVAFWIRTTQTGNNTAHLAPGVTGIEQTDGANDVFWGFIDAAGGIGVAAANSGGAKSDPINDDRWHHVALTRDSGSGRVQVFIDGKFIRAAMVTAGAKSTAFTAVGRITNAGNLRAQLDDLRVYDRVVANADLEYLATH
jgi:hypothetical protein